MWTTTQTKPSASKRAEWTNAEDTDLKWFVRKLGTDNWNNIARALNCDYGTQKRTGRQCRDRWLNYLNPTIKQYS